MKILLIIAIILPLTISGQEIFTTGDHMACHPDSIFKNSQLFVDHGKAPMYQNEESIGAYFRNKIGKIKTVDRKIVFKFILSCEGEITDVWIYKSTGNTEVDEQFVHEIKKFNFWTTAEYRSKPVDFEVTLMGAIKNKKIYLGSQMNPAMEFFEVK